MYVAMRFICFVAVYRRGYLYWSTDDELWRSRLDGSGALLLLDSELMDVGELKH